MFKMSGRSRFFLRVLLVFILAAGSAHAVDIGNVDIHGYGYQGFLITSGNRVAFPDNMSNPSSRADNKGTFDYTNLSLILSDRVTARDTVWVQIDGNTSGVSLDFSFVDHRINERATARVGQIKLPTGLYNDIHDVKFLQLSTVEPFMYFGKLLIHETYRGAGASYNMDALGGNVAVDAFGGEFVNEREQLTENYRGMYGVQITYAAPVEGLKFSGSALGQHIETLSAGEPTGAHGVEKNYIASANYVNNGIDVKAEYFYKNGTRPLVSTQHSRYIQAGYTFFDKLTPFVRYDYLTTDSRRRTDPSFYQKDVVVGAGYKINSYIVFKAENHFMNGFAVPVATMDAFSASKAKKRWNLGAVSMNFIF